MQDVEDAAISRAGSDDAESLDTMSETGGSPVSSLTGGSFWPPPVRVGFGGLRAHSGLGSFRRRSSAAGHQGALPTPMRPMRPMSVTDNELACCRAVHERANVVSSESLHRVDIDASQTQWPLTYTNTTIPFSH